MIISQVSIIVNALTFTGTALFLWGNRTIILYNKQNNTWMLKNMKFISRVEQDISLVRLLTREISWSTLEINFHTSMYY